VYETEQAIGRRTHKGAPFFNVGLCYFRAGNLMEAMQYISAAQREDSLSGSDSGLLWGGAIGQQLMRYPHNWLWGTNIAQQYSLVFNTPSQNDDFSRFISLLGFLAQFQRFEAITLVFALQSLTHVREEETDAVRLYSFHALADLLLTLESHLKIRLGRQDTLYSLCSSIVIGTPLQPHWQSIELYWNGQFGSNDWKQTVNQNRFLNDIIRDFQQLHPQSYLAALALYSCARIRNFALHSIDPASVLLSNTASLRQVVAFSLIAFRCSQATHDGSIAGLT